MFKKILHSLPSNVVMEVLREAGLLSYVKSSDPEQIFSALKPEEIRLALVPLLRRIRVSNDDFVELCREVGLKIFDTVEQQSLTISVPLVAPYATGMPLNEVAAGSVVLWKLSESVAAAVGFLAQGLDLRVPADFVMTPPELAGIGSGSVSFSLTGPAQVIGGIGAIVIAHSSIVLSKGLDPRLVVAGGAVVAVVGLVEAMLNWRKTMSDIALNQANVEKAKAEGRKVEAEARKLDAETKAIEVDTAKAGNREPASAGLSEATIHGISGQMKIDPAFAVQIINEVSPEFQLLSTVYPKPLTVSSQGTSARTMAAGAS